VFSTISEIDRLIHVLRIGGQLSFGQERLDCLLESAPIYVVETN
jgi:hypothetical protein